MNHGFFLLAAAATLLRAQAIAIDTTRSLISIHVGKAGLLSKAGHEHWVNAPISSGTITETGELAVEFKVETAKMTVKPDVAIDAKTQAQIQKDMEEMTLDTKQYPEISFHSTRIEAAGPGQWMVQGELSLHGVTRPVKMIVARTGDGYAGDVMLRQTDFGIKPISMAGGAIKIKNEIDVAVQMYSAK
jgi:polyisoprenoid-binding protein YceI